jgi:hypothetical protein
LKNARSPRRFDLTDSGLDTLGDSGVVRERRLKPAGSGSHILAIGVGSPNERAGVLRRTPPSLFSTLWIPGNA